MGSSSSVPSAFDDFYYVKKDFANLQYNHQYRIKNELTLIEQLGAVIGRVETLQVKCSLEKREGHISDEKRIKLNALSEYLELVHASLREWRQEEEENLDRLNRVRDQMKMNAKLIEEVEKGNAEAEP